MGKRGRKPGGRSKRDPHSLANNCMNCVHYKVEYAPAAHALVHSCDLTQHSKGCIGDFAPREKS